MKTPLVSVVIACHNEARWIVPTVESVLAQTHGELELLVVDDGSTDDTANLVEAMRDSRIRVIRQERAGACVARNTGLGVARGELIQMLDGDDLLAPDKIENQVGMWRQHGNRYVYFGPFGRFMHAPDRAVFASRANWRDMSGHAWLVSAWSDGGMMAPHSWLTPAPIVRAAGGWDESLLQNQDGEFFSRVLLASDGVRYCAEARSYYRMAPRISISERSDFAARESRLRATVMIAERLMAQDDSPRTRAACGNIFEELMFSTYPQFPELSRRAAEHLDKVGGGDGTCPFRGSAFKRVSRLTGWRLARRAQDWWYRLTDPTPLHRLRRMRRR